MEKCRRVIVGLLLLVMLSLNSSCLGKNAECAEEDQAALLDLKAGILDDPNGVLESWTGDDCCRWSDVLCYSHSGRVVNLILNMNQGNNSEYMSGTISESITCTSSISKYSSDSHLLLANGSYTMGATLSLLAIVYSATVDQGT